MKRLHRLSLRQPRYLGFNIASTKGSIYFLLLVCLLIAMLGSLARRAVAGQAMAAAYQQTLSVTQEKNEQLSAEKQRLADKLAQSRTFVVKPEIQELSRYYIKKYFGKDADRVITVMSCESGLDPQRVHINKDGSRDMGLFQIHDEITHRANFQRMFGVPLEIGAFDYDMSARYSKFLWDRNPGNWVCNSIV